MSQNSNSPEGVPEVPPTRVDSLFPGPQSSDTDQDHIGTIAFAGSPQMANPAPPQPVPVAIPVQGPKIHAKPSTAKVHHRLPPGIARDYELRERLGGGGEAVVYRALDRRGNREVAIKIYNITPSYAFQIGDHDHRTYFRHEHTVDLYERREEDGLHIEVMELCPLGTLARLANGQPLNYSRLCQVIREIAEALHSMHPMYHGDIKPHNILVRSLEPFDLVLTDFGLSKNLKDRARKTSLGLGTYMYQPPEAAYASQLADDWWALGIVVAELAAGYHPFDDLPKQWRAGPRLREILTTEEVPLEHLKDERIKLLCQGLLTRLPADRWGYQQVAQWLDGATPVVNRGPEKQMTKFGYAFDGVIHRDPAPLGHAIRASRNSTQVGHGQRLDELVAWVTDTPLHHPVSRIAAEASSRGPEHTAALLASVLAGDNRMVLRGLDLSTPQGRHQAGQDPQLLEQLRHNATLREFGTLTDNEEVTVLDHTWNVIVEAATRTLPAEILDDQVRSRVLQGAWQLASDPNLAHTLGDEIRQITQANPWLGQVVWFTTIWDDDADPTRTLAAWAAIGPALGQARNLANQAAAEQERQQQEHQRRLAEQERAQQAEKQLRIAQVQAAKYARGMRRKEQLAPLIRGLLGFGVVWHLWLLLLWRISGSSQQLMDWLQEPTIGYLVMMLVTLLVALPVAGHRRFESQVLFMHILLAGLLGMAGHPATQVFAPGTSPYQLLGFGSLTTDSRMWPYIAAVLMMTGYCISVLVRPELMYPPPSNLARTRRRLIALATLPIPPITMAYLLTQPAAPPGEHPVLYALGGLAFLAAAMLAITWPMITLRGYTTAIVGLIAVLASLAQVGYFLVPVIRSPFDAVIAEVCVHSGVCPAPSGIGDWLLMPMGVGLGLIIVYSLTVYLTALLRAVRRRPFRQLPLTG